MRRRKEILEGQRYRKIGRVGTTWEVIAIRRDPLGNVHAQLCRTDDPLTLKTLSSAALCDPELYERVADAELA